MSLKKTLLGAALASSLLISGYGVANAYYYVHYHTHYTYCQKGVCNVHINKYKKVCTYYNGCTVRNVHYHYVYRR